MNYKKNNKKKEMLIEFLDKYSDNSTVSFHMPGHKGSCFFEKYGYGDILKKIVDCDITEIPGADNLFEPEEGILDLMDRYARAYKAKKSYLLVNGSTCGLLASVLTVASDGDTIIVGNNCHQSVLNGIYLARAKKSVVEASYIEEYGIDGEFLTENIIKSIEANPKAKAVLITSPNYYGIVSDIKSISKIVHDAGMLLIVDQAHGSHLPFFHEKFAAELNGADIVINSTHKSMGTFTQCAIANICSDRVDLNRFEGNLQILQSSSPSYLFLTSFAMNIGILEKYGNEIMAKWNSDLEEFLVESKSLNCLKVLSMDTLEMSKINIIAKEKYQNIVTGRYIEDFLATQNIVLEMSYKKIALAMTGIGSEKSDYNKLLKGLIALDKHIESLSFNGENVAEFSAGNYRGDTASNLYHVLNIDSESPNNDKNIADKVNNAVYEKKVELIHYSKAINRKLAMNITPYPPGIPIIGIGEICLKSKLKEAYDLVKSGHKVMGMSKDGIVQVFSLR